MKKEKQLVKLTIKLTVCPLCLSIFYKEYTKHGKKYTLRGIGKYVVKMRGIHHHKLYCLRKG